MTYYIFEGNFFSVEIMRRRIEGHLNNYREIKNLVKRRCRSTRHGENSFGALNHRNGQGEKVRLYVEPVSRNVTDGNVCISYALKHANPAKTRVRIARVCVASGLRTRARGKLSFRKLRDRHLSTVAIVPVDGIRALKRPAN